MRIYPVAVVLLSVAIALASSATRAADVLQNVPHDALGIAVVKDLQSTDKKIDQLFLTLNVAYPPPAAFLRAVAGLPHDIELKGDLLIAVLPSDDEADGPWQYCVWLPAADYDRVIETLGGTGGEIAAVTIADEDLLVARHGEWALFMDPGQRERMETILKAAPNPPAVLADWNAWLNENDAGSVIFSSGLGELLRISAAPPARDRNAPAEEPDDLFGGPPAGEGQDAFVDLEVGGKPASPLYEPLRAAIHTWIVRSPKLSGLIKSSEAIGCAARLDDAGNATVSLRLKSEDDAWSTTDAATPLPPALYESGEFVSIGAGRFPTELMETLANVYNQAMFRELKNIELIKIEKEAAQEFSAAFETAVKDIVSWEFVSQVGDRKTGISNNAFLVVRAPNPSFVEHVKDVMRLWNKMQRDASGAAHYVFDVKNTKVADRSATRYVLDVAALDNMPAIPEVRQIMERFFGPGGKMQLWVVALDDETALCGMGTAEQMAANVEILSRKRPIDWQTKPFEAANELLPAKADWRAFFSPQGYYKRQKLVNDANLEGVAVLGGKKRKEFAASPPVAFSGTASKNELRIDAAVPAETIQSAGQTMKKDP